jgi:hypothetical protein
MAAMVTLRSEESLPVEWITVPVNSSALLTKCDQREIDRKHILVDTQSLA